MAVVEFYITVCAYRSLFRFFSCMNEVPVGALEAYLYKSVVVI